MTTNVLGPGPNLLLTSSSTGAGNWHRIHPKLGKLAFSVLHTGTSAGATVGSTVLIEVSNDGVNALTSAPIVVAIAGDTPQAWGAGIDLNWSYVRAVINSVVAATAGSTGSGFAIAVHCSAQLRS